MSLQVAVQSVPVTFDADRKLTSLRKGSKPQDCLYRIEIHYFRDFGRALGVVKWTKLIIN